MVVEWRVHRARVIGPKRSGKCLEHALGSRIPLHQLC